MPCDPISGEELYPCKNCGTLRTQAEGGTTFTLCDECWDKKYPKHEKEKTMHSVDMEFEVDHKQKQITIFGELPDGAFFLLHGGGGTLRRKIQLLTTGEPPQTVYQIVQTGQVFSPLNIKIGEKIILMKQVQKARFIVDPQDRDPEADGRQ